MKKIIYSLIICILTLSSNAQEEYNYEYLAFTYSWTGDINTSFNGGSLKDFMAARPGYKIVSTMGAPHNCVILEKATRKDGKTITDAINAAKLDMEAKINAVTDAKINDAVSKLRAQLLESVKDTKLFDENYKKALVDQAVAQFRIELSASIEALKKEIKN